MEAYRESKRVEPVRVAVRCRPLRAQEESIVKVNNKYEVSITNPKTANNQENPKTFHFSHVFGPETSQSALYNEMASRPVDNVLQGNNWIIFAYGQAGAGKAYTMQGNMDSEETKGIIPRAIEQIFNHIQSTPNKQFVIQISFLEICNEQVIDLLDKDRKNKLSIQEKTGKSFHVPVESLADAYQLLATGYQNKTIQSTSYTIFSIIVESSETGSDGKTVIKRGKLNLVCFPAGSERPGINDPIGISINGLREVIIALASPMPRNVPDKNLTIMKLLQESFHEKAKAVMIANIEPSDRNYDETMSTLRYASGATMIMGKPIVEEPLGEKRSEGEEFICGESEEDPRDKKKIESALSDFERQMLFGDSADDQEEDPFEVENFEEKPTIIGQKPSTIGQKPSNIGKKPTQNKPSLYH